METKNPNTFWGHVDELVKRMKVVLFVFIISLVAILFLPGNLNFLTDLSNYQPWISIFLKSIRESVLPPNVKLIAVGFTDPIELYVLASVVFSVAITLPLFTYEAYKFIDPALHANEKKEIYPTITAVVLLFIAGAAFGYFILFPFFIWSMFPFFTAVGAELWFSIMDFYNVLFFTIIAMGLIFTIPVFFALLVKYGVVHTDLFRRNRKYLYLGLIIVAMFISPGASPQGNLFLFVPLALLFETSLFMGKRYEKKRAKRQIELFADTKCKFCQVQLTSSSTFCYECGKSQS